MSKAYLLILPPMTKTISSFGSKETALIWEGKTSLKLPQDIQQTARRKLRMINNAASLKDLQIPPANKLEKLKGNLVDFYSIRINNQYRIIFKWIDNLAEAVEIIDYH